MGPIMASGVTNITPEAWRLNNCARLLYSSIRWLAALSYLQIATPTPSLRSLSIYTHVYYLMSGR